jgi:hypothetical protein
MDFDKIWYWLSVLRSLLGEGVGGWEVMVRVRLAPVHLT